MARYPHPDNEPLHVVVAGAGVSGLETLVALRGLVGHRVALTLVAPEDDFTVHAMEVAEGFGRGRAQRFALGELAAELDARLLADAVARVERDDRVIALRSGAELPYDVLVLAIGAHPHPAYEHGVCFERAHHAQAFDAVLADLRAGTARRVAIVVPPGCAWTLPAYELALMASSQRGSARLTLITPELEPLEAFGTPATGMIRAELAAAGVELLEAAEAFVPAPGLVELASGARVRCDRVVHLPLLAGPNCHGVPCDWGGFIEVDEAFRVRDSEDLYAIGDATAGTYKQGGLAAQQADVVAEHIAWRMGADHAPRAYRPVLRGLLSTPAGPRYLRAEPPGGRLSAEVSREPLWWPASKVSARWLIPWLAARDVAERPVPEPRRLPTGGLSWSVGA